MPKKQSKVEEVGRFTGVSKVRFHFTGRPASSFEKFEKMTKKLVAVPKKEIDEKAKELKAKPKSKG